MNDSITSIYCDYNFPLTNFSFTFPSATQASVAVMNGAVTPNNILAPGGLNVGDLLLFIVSTPGNGKARQGTSIAQTAAAVARNYGHPQQLPPSTSPLATPSISIRRGANSLAHPSPLPWSQAPPSPSAGFTPSLISCRFPSPAEPSKLRA